VRSGKPARPVRDYREFLCRGSGGMGEPEDKCRESARRHFRLRKRRGAVARKPVAAREK